MIIENGKLVLPAAEQQKLILGRGVAAELRCVQLEEESRVLRDDVASIRAELEKLLPEPDPENLGSPQDPLPLP